MDILGIDTATGACSVAVGIRGEVIQEYQVQPAGHAKLVLKMVDAVLHQAGIKLTRLDAIAVNTGPGSFTGVRIGLGVAQGLAYGAGLPVIGVCSLVVLAAAMDTTAIDTAVMDQCVVLPAIDARMNQIYCGLYELAADSDPDEIVQPVVTAPDLIPFRINSTDTTVYGLGSGWEVYSEKIRSNIGDCRIVRIPNKYSEARVLVQVAAQKGLKSSLAPMLLQATYIRNNIVQRPAE